MAYLTRIRLDAEGRSAADIEERFINARDDIVKAIAAAVSAVQLVTEMGYDEDGQSITKGRYVLAVQLDGMVTADSDAGTYIEAPVGVSPDEAVRGHFSRG